MKEASFANLAGIQFDTICLAPISSLRLWLRSSYVLITFSGAGIFWDFERAHYTVVASVNFTNSRVCANLLIFVHKVNSVWIG